MMNSWPVFILGMPRCRTAWLSLALLSLGVDCSHEGLRDHASFADYADDLDARLACGLAGDADPSLVYWVDQIVARWPQARFLVVFREDSDGLEALVRAAREFEGPVRARWSGFLAAFKRACDVLRALGPQTRCLPAAQLSDNDTLPGAMEHLTGRRPDATWARRLQRLHVTSTIDPTSSVALPPSSPRIVLPARTGLETTGLSAALYANADFEMVTGWWNAHNDRRLLQAALPPLGVVVSHEGEPWAAIWCYECYGVPVAELTFPVTRPGLGIGDASRALLYGALACMHLAGKGHQPEGVFHTFKVVAPQPMTRFLKKLGFTEYLTGRVPMIVTL